MTFDVGAGNREIVLENDAIVGSVNANLRHYEAAAAALAAPTRAGCPGSSRDGCRCTGSPTRWPRTTTTSRWCSR
jgi:hypothetical protein